LFSQARTERLQRRSDAPESQIILDRPLRRGVDRDKADLFTFAFDPKMHDVLRC
jgi:hypothetical protein